MRVSRLVDLDRTEQITPYSQNHPERTQGRIPRTLDPEKHRPDQRVGPAPYYKRPVNIGYEQQKAKYR